MCFTFSNNPSSERLFIATLTASLQNLSTEIQNKMWQQINKEEEEEEEEEEDTQPNQSEDNPTV